MKRIILLFSLLSLTSISAKSFKEMSFFAQKGNIRAQYDLGLFYRKKPTLSFNWFHKSAVKGCKKAQYELGLLFHYGLGVRQNYELAQLWFNRASKQGDARATIILYRFYMGSNPQNMQRKKVAYRQNFRTIR